MDRVTAAVLVAASGVLASCGGNPAQPAEVAFAHVEPKVIPEVDVYTPLELGDMAPEESKAALDALDIDDHARNVRHVATVETPDGPRDLILWDSVGDGLPFFRGPAECEIDLHDGTGYQSRACRDLDEPFAVFVGRPAYGLVNFNRQLIDEQATPIEELESVSAEAAVVVAEYESGELVGSEVIDGLAWFEPPFDPHENKPVRMKFYDAEGTELHHVNLDW